jgi:hypothetical protein
MIYARWERKPLVFRRAGPAFSAVRAGALFLAWYLGLTQVPGS